MDRDLRQQIRRGLLSEALTTAKDASASASDRNTAGRAARNLLDEIEREELLAKAEVTAELDRVKSERSSRRDSTMMGEREFLVWALKLAQKDMEKVRRKGTNSQAISATRGQMITLRQQIAEYDAAQAAADPYAALSPPERVVKLEEEVLRYLHDDVLLACIREYCERHGARCTLTRKEDGTKVELAVGGWR